MKRVEVWDWLAFVALALPLMLPFLQPGLPATADAEIHLHRLVSAAVNIENGYIWPRWTPYLHGDYGYPIHNFYAPGIHIIGGLIYLVTNLDPVIILKLMQFAFTLAYPAGAYLLVRRYGGRAGGLVSAAAYLYVPFRFHELWLQTNLSQFGAMALLPWLLWAVDRCREQPSLRRMSLIGVLLAGIVLIHHPTAFLFAPFAALYAAVLNAGTARSTRQWVIGTAWAAGGFVVGLALSAVFWLPALLELRYTQISQQQTGLLSFAGNFVMPEDLLAGAGLIDRSARDLPLLLRLGLPHWTLTGVAAVAVIWMALRRRTSRDYPAGMRRLVLIALVNAVLLALCAFMMTPYSERVWRVLPVANLVVYPWRLLGVTAVLTMMSAALIPSLFPSRWRTWAAGGLVLVFTFSSVPLLYAPLDFDQPSAPTVVGAHEYEGKTGNVGLTSGNEYLPQWAQQRPLGLLGGERPAREWRVAIEVLPLDASAQPVDCGRGRSCFVVESPGSGRMVLHQMYFPGWSVLVNGLPAETDPEGERGLLSLVVPAGGSRVEVWYGGTTAQQAAGWISLMGWLGVAGIFAVGRRNSLRRDVSQRSIDHPAETPRLSQVIGAFLLGFVLVNQFVILPNTEGLTWRSDPANPPAQTRIRTVFGEVIELVGYDLARTEAMPGDIIQVRLYWHLLQPVSEVLNGAVQVTDVEGREQWGGVDHLPLALSYSTEWSTGQYVTDTYQFALRPDAPPYLGQMRVSVFLKRDSGLEYLPTTDGQAYAVLTDFRLVGSMPELSGMTPLDVRLGEPVNLRGYWLETEADTTCITLRWQAQRAGSSDYAVLLHQLDAVGTFLQANDGPPQDGLYPMTRWLNGQALNDRHCFNRVDGATSLAIGLYDRVDGARLPMMDGQGQRLVDDVWKVDLPS